MTNVNVTRPSLSSRSKKWLFIALASPVALFFLTLWFVPILYGVVASFFTNVIGVPEFVGVENYLELFSEASFWTALWNSVVFAIGTTVLSIGLGLGLALAVNQKLRGGTGLRTLMIFPYLIPTIVVVFLWRFLLDQGNGLVNIFFLSLGILDQPIAFFSDLTWAMPSVVMMSVWKYAPFAFFIFLAQLQAIDDSLYERARMDGASIWQSFRDITFPHIRTTLYLVVFIRGVWLFNTFDLIWVATKGGPLSATTTLPIRIYRIVFADFNFAKGAALGTILFVFLMVNAAIYFKVFDPTGEVESA